MAKTNKKQPKQEPKKTAKKELMDEADNLLDGIEQDEDGGCKL